MNKDIINLQTKRVEAEIALLSSKLVTAIEELVAAGKLLTSGTERLVEIALALEELHGAIGDPEEAE